MTDNDLIRRGDALALPRHEPALQGTREDWAGMDEDECGDWVSIDAINAIPAALDTPDVAVLVEAVKELLQIRAVWTDPHNDEICGKVRAALARVKG